MKIIVKEGDKETVLFGNQKEPTPTNPFLGFDIIADTAKKINSGELNVFDDSQVNWELVTMYNMDNIKRLLSKIDTLLVEDTADAIISSIDGKYDPENPYDKPQVWSPYYEPDTAILWEQGDWHYENTIRSFSKQLIKKKQKKEEYQRKMEVRKQNNNKKNVPTIPPFPPISTPFISQLYKKAPNQGGVQKQAEKSVNSSTSAQETDFNIENVNLTCGPYEIAPKKKTAFMSVIWVLKELGFFVKKADGSYATNRSDVIDSFLTQKGNSDQLLPKALKTDTFMNVFNKLLEKASEMYLKDNKK